MKFRICLILILIYHCTSFDIIPISDYEYKEIQFNQSNKYFVFEYTNQKGLGTEMIIMKNDYQEKFDIYLYLNASNIDENFINYYKKDDFSTSIFSIIADEFLSGKFNIIVSYQNETKKNINIRMFSAKDIYNIINQKTFFKNFSDHEIIINYNAKYPSNNEEKYISLRFVGNYYNPNEEIIAIENNNNIYIKA